MQTEMDAINLRLDAIDSRALGEPSPAPAPAPAAAPAPAPAPAPARPTEPQPTPVAPPEGGNDAVWRQLSEEDPYWAVISLPQYRSGVLDERARAEFFASGADHVASLLFTISERFGADPHDLGTVLDFGCGVGRLTVELARQGYDVTGVDVSQRMLDICAGNLAEIGQSARLIVPDASLSGLSDAEFDLCLSSIVFQHIEPSRGLATFRRLFETVRPGGFMCHFFLFGPERRGGAVGVGTGIAQHIQMNEYDTNELLAICAEYSSSTYLELMQHGPHSAMNLYAQRRA